MKHIEGDYYLDHDGMQFILKEDTGNVTLDKKTGEYKDVYKNHGFSRQPEELLNKYVNLKIAKSEAKNIVELAEEIKSLKKFFRDMFKEEAK